MIELFRAAPHLAQLKDFQQRTVRHVVRRFYDDENPTRRFLVADETGLGKSIVARGVIAETVERLLHDDSVSRIDVVYVCSNADIAAQNLSRLNGHCCVVAGQGRPRRWRGPRSDGGGELGERNREPLRWADIGGEFVVAAP